MDININNIYTNWITRYYFFLNYDIVDAEGNHPRINDKELRLDVENKLNNMSDDEFNSMISRFNKLWENNKSHREYLKKRNKPLYLIGYNFRTTNFTFIINTRYGFTISNSFDYHCL